MNGIILQNKSCLEQGNELLEQLTQGLYQARHANAYDSTIGDHFRHILEFYTTFFEGLEKGLVDYGARNRDAAIAQDPEVARQQVQAQIRNLESIEDLDDQRVRVVSEEAGAPPGVSSLSRELNFLLSHTIHHFALIAFICRSIKIQLPANFGVAPSTLRYQQSLND